jgi:hypothetical protein
MYRSVSPRLISMRLYATVGSASTQIFRYRPLEVLEPLEVLDVPRVIFA